MDYYETLGAAREATADDIRKAYRRAASKAHPDRNGGDEKRMQEVNKAYACLGDEERRAGYDATGQDGGNTNTVQDRGLALLVAIFRKLLDRLDMDPVSGARSEIACTRAHAVETKQRAQSLRPLLEKRKAPVKVTDGGTNVWHGLLDERLAELGRVEHGATEALREIAAAEQMLELYVFMPPTVPKASTNGPGSPFGYFMRTGAF